MNKIFLFFIFGLYFSNSTRIDPFENEVKYPPKLDVYKFTLIVAHGLSMGIWNEDRKTYDPVYELGENLIYFRNFSYTDTCDAKTQIKDKNILDGMVRASGIHRNMLLINKIFPGIN